jgi:putative nucleotidyltransferase with HDIG domain
VGGVLLSAALAVILTTLYGGELLAPQLAPPPEGQAAKISLRAGAPAASRVVLSRGQVMTRELAARLPTMEHGRRQNPLGPLIGYALAVILGATLLSAFLRAQPPLGPLARTQAVLFGALLIGTLLGKGFLLLTPYPALWLPTATLPMLCAWVIDRRVGHTAAVMAAFMSMLLVPVDLFLMVVVLAQGLTAASFLEPNKRQSSVWLGGLAAGVIGVLAYGTLLLMAYGRIPIEELSLKQSGLLAALAVGPISAVLTLVLVLPMTSLVGTVSRSQLVDLGDMNSDLLKYIAERAPGTWQHSLAMANLAEAAANAIGANGLLTRVGAYYHDLGKTVQPEYYVENQKGGPNPHDNLEPDVSADAIFSHVVEGVKIARRQGIPERVTDFVHMHHGTSMLQYFFNKNMELGNPKGLAEIDFRYPGVKPQSKETAIIMICDAVEAASRTLGANPERKAIDMALQKIIFEKLQTGQFDESGLSVSDLSRIAKSLGDSLAGALHVRIKYPWQKEEDAKKGAAPQPAQNGAGPQPGQPARAGAPSR